MKREATSVCRNRPRPQRVFVTANQEGVDQAPTPAWVLIAVAILLLTACAEQAHCVSLTAWQGRLLAFEKQDPEAEIDDALGVALESHRC